MRAAVPTIKKIGGHAGFAGLAHPTACFIFDILTALVARLAVPPAREDHMNEIAMATTTTTALKLRKLGVFLGAEVTGIDLTRPLGDAVVAAIGDALATHEVLVFPRQTITSE